MQLGNVAEFYITFFALLQIGVAPVNALFSHQRSELSAYAEQISPAVLIADRDHTLFAGDDFLNTFVDAHRSVRAVLLRGDKGEHALEAAISRPADNFIPNPTPADEVAFFQLRRQHRHAEADPAYAQRLRLQHSPQQRNLRYHCAHPLSERASRGAQLRHEFAGIVRRFHGGRLRGAG